MKHNRILIALLLIALGWNIGLAARALYATPAPVTYLPIVQRAVESSTCNASAPILDQDTGTLSAGLDASGRYIIAYQDRAHGSQAHVAQHVGDHLVELAAPLTGTAVLPSPQFSPDGVKQGSLALVMGPPGQKNRLYFTQRVADDTPNEGPYGIWCLEFP